MQIEDLTDLSESGSLTADVVIVGGGPAGLTVARSVAETGREVLLLESGGLNETPEAEALNAVEVAPDIWTDTQVQRRKEYHTPQAKFWDHDLQGYGVRCRMLGGSTAAWAGKSAAFDDIDFEARPWVPMSGWPISRSEIVDDVDLAAKTLNLGVNCYDDALWDVMAREAPQPRPDPEFLQSFFWQFARSTLDPMDVMRSGSEFLANPPPRCRVLTGATVLSVLTEASGRTAMGVRVADAGGRCRDIKARTVVLAASTIENARILLNSRSEVHPNGLGNNYDTVGRYLMDHPSAVIGHFHPSDITSMSQMFGFYGVRTAGAVHMYMRGLSPTRAVQEKNGLLNCAIFMPAERAEDDPWDAAKRLLRRESSQPMSDVLAILKSPWLVTKGLGRLALQSERFPKALSQFVINRVIQMYPNLAVEEYLTGGVPHKLVGLPIQGIVEQVPERDNRVTLSSKRDRFDMPLPTVHWRVGEAEVRTLIKVMELTQTAFANAGLPQPVAEEWVAHRDFAKAAIIDSAHSAGTTRMSSDPKTGVVDANCQVHGCGGLYVAGASVFPTIGHANPTLMIVAFAHRLARHLSSQ